MAIRKQIRVHNSEGIIIFDFIPPVIRKDKADVKWYAHYSIKYPGKDNKFVRYRHYGEGLNREPDINQRKRDAKDLVAALIKMLNEGVDPKNKNSLLEAQQREIEKEKRHSFQTLYDFFLDIKGYKYPKPKQLRSSMNMKRFFENQFLPHLQKCEIDHNLTLVTKSHVLDFLNEKFLGIGDDKVKWNNTTVNNSRQWISTFFNTLIYEDKINMTNPCNTIKRKPKNPVDRYEIFTPEEIKILFNHLNKIDFNYSVACQMIYYAYIRSSEISRLRVSSIDLDKRVIRIKADDAKGSRDGLERDVLISKDLHASLSRYLELNPNKPTDFLFGRKVKPSEYVLSLCWHEKFKDYLDNLKKDSKFFQRDGLTMYSLKHSGVTHFVHNNMKEKGSLNVLRFVQSQCRHTKFEITQIYLKKLPISIKEHDEYVYEGF